MGNPVTLLLSPYLKHLVSFGNFGIVEKKSYRRYAKYNIDVNTSLCTLMIMIIVCMLTAYLYQKFHKDLVHIAHRHLAKFVSRTQTGFS